MDFDQARLRNLSPSSISLYQASPALWAMRYLCGVKDDSDKPAIWRGNAVEAAVDVALYGAPEAEAIAKANEIFELSAQGLADDMTEKVRAQLPRCVKSAFKAINEPERIPAPFSRQMKIEVWVTGVPVPLIGFVDYVWPEWLFDLKAPAAKPSKPQLAHVMQIATYWRALNRAPKLLYAAPTGHYWYTPEHDELEAAWRQMEIGARAIARLLSRVSNGDDALRMFAPNLDDFRWSDPLREKYHALMAA